MRPYAVRWFFVLDTMEENINYISQYEVLFRYHKVNKDIAWKVASDLLDGHCVFLITDSDSLIEDFRYYAKHESDGQLLSGTMQDFINFKNNNYDIEKETE